MQTKNALLRCTYTGSHVRKHTRMLWCSSTDKACDRLPSKTKAQLWCCLFVISYLWSYISLLACACFSFQWWVIPRSSAVEFCDVGSLLLCRWNVVWRHVAEVFISSKELGECNQTVLIDSRDSYSSSHIRALWRNISVWFSGCVEMLPRRGEASNN